MSINLNIDNDLLDEAFELSGCRTKSETVNEALREFIQCRKQLEIISLFGKIDFDPDYARKAGRNGPERD